MVFRLEVSEEGVQIQSEKKNKKLVFSEESLLQHMSPFLAHADELVDPLESEL